jgi:hypothetical protein
MGPIRRRLVRLAPRRADCGLGEPLGAVARRDLESRAGYEPHRVPEATSPTGGSQGGRTS